MAATDVWFPTYVRETVAAWAELVKKRPASEESLLAHTIGKLGERYVVRRLVGNRYHAVQSQNGRSPSNVWGLAIVGGIVHLPLLRVKASEVGEPDDPSKDDEIAFAKFTAFAYDKFRDSAVVPKETRNAPSSFPPGMQASRSRKSPSS